MKERIAFVSEMVGDPRGGSDQRSRTVAQLLSQPVHVGVQVLGLPRVGGSPHGGQDHLVRAHLSGMDGQKGEHVGEAIAVEAARNFRLLRKRGITIRKTIDLLIGTWCIENRRPLLHNDNDFRPMARHLGLVEAPSAA